MVDLRRIIYSELSDKARGWISQPYRDKPIEVWPGIFSDDPKHHDFLRKMARAFPQPSVDSGFLQPPFGPTDPAEYMQVSGYLMNPLGSIPNTERTSKSELYYKVLDVVAHVCDGFIPSSVKVDRDSTSSYPYMSKDPIFKAWLVSRGIKAMPSLFDKTYKLRADDKFGFLSTCWSIMETLPVFMEGRRVQPEAIYTEKDGFRRKLREVTDWNGKKVKVNRDTPWRDLAALRSRLVYMFAAAYNYPLQFIGAGHRAFYSRKLSALFKHDMTKFGEKIDSGLVLIGLDVGNHDQSVDARVLDTIILKNMSFISDEAKTFIRRLYTMPVIIKNDYKGQSGSKLLGLDWSMDGAPLGNPSGIFQVSDIVKISGAAIPITILHEVMLGENWTTESSNFVLKLLNNELEGAQIFSGGDDNLLAVKPELADSVREAITTCKEKHGWKTEIEPTTKFLGHYFVKDGGRIMAVSDAGNLIKKRSLAERSFRSRRYGKFGFHMALELHEQTSPFFSHFWPIARRLFADSLGMDPMKLMIIDEFPPLFSDMRNAAEVEFAADPSTLHYKALTDDIREELIDTYFISFSPEKFGDLGGHVKI